MSKWTFEVCSWIHESFSVIPVHPQIESLSVDSLVLPSCQSVSSTPQTFSERTSDPVDLQVKPQVLVK